jgi:hypothetical protein
MLSNFRKLLKDRMLFAVECTGILREVRRMNKRTITRGLILGLLLMGIIDATICSGQLILYCQQS